MSEIFYNCARYLCHQTLKSKIHVTRRKKHNNTDVEFWFVQMRNYMRRQQIKCKQYINKKMIN